MCRFRISIFATDGNQNLAAPEETICFYLAHMDETSLENANFETSFDYDHGLFDDVVIVAFCKIEPKKMRIH